MSDFADDGSAREEEERERAIAAARRKVAEAAAAPVSDDCANGCGEARRPPSLYCCSSCRDEADRRARIRRNQGLR